MRYLPLFLLVLSMTVRVSGQDYSSPKAWTLQACIDYALENNIQVKMQSLDVELSEANLWQSKAQRLPSLNGNASHSYNYGRRVDQFTNQFAADRVQSNNFYISSQAVLFQGFQIHNAIEKASLDLQASQYDIDKMRDDISMSIATLYLQVLFNTELLEIAENQLEVTEQQVDRTRQLVEAGTLAKGALLTIEAQAAAEASSVVQAQNQLLLSKLDLVQLMELPDIEQFVIDVPEVDVDSIGFSLLSPGHTFQFALSNQPDVLAADLRVSSAETGLRVAKGSYSPSLTISGSWGTGYSGASQEFTGFTTSGYDTIGYTASLEPVFAPSLQAQYELSPFWDQIRDNDNKSLGIYLTVPIFNNLRSRTGVQQAEIAIRNMEYSRELVRNDLRKRIEQAYADALAALKRYEASMVSVNALQESFSYTEERFNVGMVNSVEYNEAKNSLMQAQSELLQAKYEFVFRSKIIDFYNGKPLSL